MLTQPPVVRLREKFDARYYPTEGVKDGTTATKGNTDMHTWRWLRHAANTLFLEEERDYPTAKCFESALEFLDLNKDADSWFYSSSALIHTNPSQHLNASNTSFRQAIRARFSIGRSMRESLRVR